MTPKKVFEKTEFVRNMLDKYGFNDAESILNEWNYVRGWEGDDWIYSLKSEKGLKGASFTAGTMCIEQYSSLDMLMYYDARPCGMNGLYNTDFVNECLKGYYPFRMFNELYKLDECVEVGSDSNEIYVCAAKSHNKAAVMLTHFSDDDSTPQKQVTVNFGKIPNTRAEIYMLDAENDMDLLKEEVVSDNKITLRLPLFSTCLIKLTEA